MTRKQGNGEPTSPIWGTLEGRLPEVGIAAGMGAEQKVLAMSKSSPTP